MNKSPFFWTDLDQAVERLQGTLVTFNGSPVLVEAVDHNHDTVGGAPIGHLVDCTTSKRLRKPLDDAGFNKFRQLPKLGWFNHSDPQYGAVLLERGARRTRSHGLCNANVSVRKLLTAGGGEYTPATFGLNISHMYYDKGFAVDLQQGLYPSLEQILINIERGSAIAYSPSFVVCRDSLGLRWLYRSSERIGLFTGADTLNLFEQFGFHREEIMEDPSFTLNNIREF